jgi:hypothetical protein
VRTAAGAASLKHGSSHFAGVYTVFLTKTTSNLLPTRRVPSH